MPSPLWIMRTWRCSRETAALSVFEMSKCNCRTRADALIKLSMINECTLAGVIKELKMSSATGDCRPLKVKSWRGVVEQNSRWKSQLPLCVYKTEWKKRMKKNTYFRGGAVLCAISALQFLILVSPPDTWLRWRYLDIKKPNGSLDGHTKLTLKCPNHRNAQTNEWKLLKREGLDISQKCGLSVQVTR